MSFWIQSLPGRIGGGDGGQGEWGNGAGWHSKVLAMGMAAGAYNLSTGEAVTEDPWGWPI